MLSFLMDIFNVSKLHRAVSRTEILLQTLLTLHGAVLTHMHACGNQVLTLHGCLTTDVTTAKQGLSVYTRCSVRFFISYPYNSHSALHNVLTGFPLFW